MTRCLVQLTNGLMGVGVGRDVHAAEQVGDLPGPLLS